VAYVSSVTLTELDSQECLALLRDNDTGRVAFVSGDHPVILPVNYALDGDLIVFRTGPGQKLTEIPMRNVAFEIDGKVADGAWSVLAQGYAREVTNAIGEPYESLRAIPIPVTAPGDRDHWIAIHVDQITGRRIH
jgi:uncharacterized protein